MANGQNTNNGGIVGDGGFAAPADTIGWSGARLDERLTDDGQGGLRTSDVFDADLRAALLGWHRRIMQHGDAAFFGQENHDPPLEALLAIPTNERVPDLGPLIAEALARKGIEPPDRSTNVAWDEADRAAGGVGGDPDKEYAYALYAVDPELTVTSGETRICGVPETIFYALPTDDDRAKVLAGRVIASPHSAPQAAAWVLRNRQTVRGLIATPTGRRRRVWMRTLIRTGPTWCEYTNTGGGPARWVARPNPEWMRGHLRRVLRGMYYIKPTKHTSQGQVSYSYELKPWTSKISTLKEVEAALADLVTDHTGTDTAARELPDAYGDARGVYPAAGAWVLCRNGVLDVNTGHLLEATPLWFSLTRVEADWDPRLDPDAAGTAWLRMLHDQWADDPGAIACLGEWFGYVLSGRTDKQKGMFIRGVSGSGKGNIAAVLTALVDGSVSTSLHRLNTNFGLAKLYTSGATLAVMGDVRFNTPDSSLAVENLLGIIGQDVMPVDIKYQDEVDAALPVRFHLSANEFPNIPDNAAAMARRLLMLNATHSFTEIPGMEDSGLRDRIIANELAHVLRWAVAGLQRLNSKGDFTRSHCHDEMIAALKAVMSPALGFAQDCAVAGGDNEYVTQDEVWRAWSLWAGQNGHKPGTKVRFIDKLTSLPDFPMFKAGQKRGVGRVIYGLSKVAQHNVLAP